MVPTLDKHVDNFSFVKSESMFKKIKDYVPGGVNSPVRAFRSLGITPPFIDSASGAYLTDIDGNQYIDYVASWGPMILGHANPAVIKKVQETATKGLTFGAPSVHELELAKLICQRIPSVEKIRMVTSGTEANMAALRLARGVTKRPKIIKFEGSYHGHLDSLLAGGSLNNNSHHCEVESTGITRGVANDTLVATYNDLDSVQKLFEKNKEDIAAVIVEPISGNMNVVLPVPGFLTGLFDLCERYGSLLIFDEVMTGFRVGPQCAQGVYGVRPHLTTFGKIIGGGMPIGAYGGSADIMNQVSPLGPVFQGGTFSGNPLTMVAGLETLKQLTDSSYTELLKMTKNLVGALVECAESVGLPVTSNHCCGIFGLFFTTEKDITRYEQAINCDQVQFSKFFNLMLRSGIYLVPAALEPSFVSLSHTQKEFDKTILAAEKAFKLCLTTK